MGPVVFVLTLAVLCTTGLVSASVCPQWTNEQHGDLLIKCCHLPTTANDNNDFCRALTEEFRGDNGVELCVKAGMKSRERRQFGVGGGSPPPPPPPPPPRTLK